MKCLKFFYHMLEHAVFYLVLASLAIGAAGSIHQKITDRTAGYEVHTEHISTIPVSGNLPVISMKELISPELLPACGLYSTTADIR